MGFQSRRRSRHDLGQQRLHRGADLLPAPGDRTVDDGVLGWPRRLSAVPGPARVAAPDRSGLVRSNLALRLAYLPNLGSANVRRLDTLGNRQRLARLPLEPPAHP